MSVRKEFEEFCRRTRPPMSTSRNLHLEGWGDYTNVTTKGAWRAWRHLAKQAAQADGRARAASNSTIVASVLGETVSVPKELL